MSSKLGSIAREALKTRRNFQGLCHAAKDRVSEENVPEGVHADAKFLTDCLDRFHIWAGSLGVFQKGESSLDGRLANHSIVLEILRLLRQLDTFANDLKTIINGDQEQQTWTKDALHQALYDSGSSEWSDDGSEILLTPDENEVGGSTGGLDFVFSESNDLHHLINESVTSLLRLSIQVHKASRKAKFSKSSLSKIYSILPDVNHVRDFYPFAATNHVLVERLGKANAQRRQWLWYRRRHREKLFVDTSEQNQARVVMLSTFEPTHAAGSIALFSDTNDDIAESVLSGTKASTFRTPVASALAPSEVPDTIFGLSSMATANERLLIPKVPINFALGVPFLCPYCRDVVEVAGPSAWQRHVHTDLSSYTCLFDGCDEMFFESRAKWWAHEMELHRTEWSCFICDLQLPDADAARKHLGQAHSSQVPTGQISDLVQRCGKAAKNIKAADCPLCDYSSILRHRGYAEDEIAHLSTDKFGRHLGRHLEQLALFILPNDDLTDEDGISDQDRDDGAGDSDVEEISASVELAPEADLLQKLSDIVSEEKVDPSNFSQAPDLAMRWQPPQDFTPPQEDFDTEDTDLLPLRQEPIYGGDLFTPGWARGVAKDKEGYCARCPVFHWVNMVDGSYRFHLTYFHGVPDSGVPLPRPTEIRPIANKTSAWEGFCEACSKWRLLKKTKRGWNWYRHWLNDHADIVKQRTDAIRNGGGLEDTQTQMFSSLTHPGNDLELSNLQDLPVSSIPFSETDPISQDSIFRFVRTNSPEATESSLTRFLQGLPETRSKSAANMTEPSGLSLLMLAASLGVYSFVEALLNHGADPNHTDPDGQTALDLAIDAGYFAIAQKLIARGADPSKSRVFEKVMSNAREYAGEMTSQSRSNDPEAVKTNIQTLSPLSQAAREGNAQAVRDLLDKDGVTNSGPSPFDVDEGAEDGRSAFMLAFLEGYREIVDILLEHGANINSTSKKGWTPLMQAARKGDDVGVLFLLERGADVNHVSPDRWTALSESTVRGSKHIMSRLLEAGADPEIRAASDWTPLMHAAYRGDLEAVKLLLDFGASFEEISARDETVMLLAAANGSADVVRLLLEAGCPPESVWSRSLAEAAVTLKPVPVDSEAGTSKAQERIERVYQVGWTPLMVACQVGSLDVVELLLDAGANIEPRSPMFKTALEIAKENGRTHIAQYLIGRLRAA